MDFWRTVAVLFRRWYITVPAFAATLVPGRRRRTPSCPSSTESGRRAGPDDAAVPAAPSTTQPDHTEPGHQPADELRRRASRLTASHRDPAADAARRLADVARGRSPAAPPATTVNNGTTNPELLQSGPVRLRHRAPAPAPRRRRTSRSRSSATAATVLDERQDEVNAPGLDAHRARGRRGAHAPGKAAATAARCARRPPSAALAGLAEPGRRLRLREPHDAPPAPPGRRGQRARSLGEVPTPSALDADDRRGSDPGRRRTSTGSSALHLVP